VGSAVEYLRFIVTLTAVVDPFLAVPFFLSFTAAYSEAQRGALARTVALTVFFVLAASAFVGEALLTFIGASLPAFRVGGGLVLLLMALAMLNAQAGCVVSWIVLRAAHRIAARMGTTGLNVATRILGLLLAAMAVQTMAVGLKALFPGLG